MLVRGWNLRGIMGITGGGEEGDEYGWWVKLVIFYYFSNCEDRVCGLFDSRV